jgi:hypothetical protein
VEAQVPEAPVATAVAEAVGLPDAVALLGEVPDPPKAEALPVFEPLGVEAARPAPPATLATPEGSPPAPAAAPFTWPGSTRLSYRLTGQYLGEVQGRAQVEWVLAGPRYQVNMDVTVGLAFAPLFSRQMRSAGRLGPQGLQPEHYEESSRLAFFSRSQARLQLDEAGVLLANGKRWTPPPAVTPAVATVFATATATATATAAAASPMAVQDSASQFVQLSYLFTRQPDLLATGRSITVMLALPRRVVPWVYEVAASETLYTAFGPVDAFHVRPAADTPRGADLLAEAWFAPALAYLPVRIRIEQTPGVFIDLLLERRPALAADSAPAAPAASSPGS